MARLPYPDLGTVSEDVRQLVESLPPLNVFRMLPHAETLVRGFVQLGTGILSRAQLDPRLRELAILHVAATSPAPYEWQQHVPIARACGATEPEIAALERGSQTAACFGERERVLLGFTDELVRGPRASDATLAEMRRLFSDREVCEAIVTIGYYMMVARFLETTGVDLETANAGASVQVVERAQRR